MHGAKIDSKLQMWWMKIAELQSKLLMPLLCVWSHHKGTVSVVLMQKIQSFSVMFFPRDGVLWRLLTAGCGGVCVSMFVMCVYVHEGGSHPSSDLLCAQGSHIVQEDADTRADGWPFRLLPWVHIYSGNRNSPPGRGRRRTRSSLLPQHSISPGSRMRWRGWELSCLGWAFRRGGVNLQPQLSPLQTPLRCGIRPYMVQPKIQLVFSLMLQTLLTNSHI